MHPDHQFSDRLEAALWLLAITVVAYVMIFCR